MDLELSRFGCRVGQILTTLPELSPLATNGFRLGTGSKGEEEKQEEFSLGVGISQGALTPGGKAVGRHNVATCNQRPNLRAENATQPLLLRFRRGTGSKGEEEKQEEFPLGVGISRGALTPGGKEMGRHNVAACNQRPNLRAENATQPLLLPITIPDEVCLATGPAGTRRLGQRLPPRQRGAALRVKQGLPSVRHPRLRARAWPPRSRPRHRSPRRWRAA